MNHQSQAYKAVLAIAALSSLGGSLGAGHGYPAKIRRSD